MATKNNNCFTVQFNESNNRWEVRAKNTDVIGSFSEDCLKEDDKKLAAILALAEALEFDSAQIGEQLNLF